MANEYIMRPGSSDTSARALSIVKAAVDKVAKRGEVKRPVKHVDYTRKPEVARATEVLSRAPWYKPSASDRRAEERALSRIHEKEYNDALETTALRNRLWEKEEEELLNTRKEGEPISIKEKNEQLIASDKLNFETAHDKYVDSTSFFDRVSDAIGLMAEHSSDGGIQESQGAIALAKDRNEQIKAWKYLQSVKALQQQNEGYIDGTIDYNKLYQDASKQYQEYIKLGVTAKDIQEMADAYKISDNRKLLAQGAKATDGRLSAYRKDALQAKYQALRDAQKAGVDIDFDYSKTMALKLKEADADIAKNNKEVQDETDSIYKDSLGGLLPSKMKRKAFWQKVYNVNDKARKLENYAGNLDWTDSNYWAWSQFTQYGYSVSSGASVASQALGVISLGAGALGTAAAGPGGGAAAYNAITLASAPLDYWGGTAENKQESAQRWSDNISTALTKTFGTDELHKEASIKDLQQQAITKAVASGLTQKAAEDMYDITNQNGLGNVLQMLGAGQISSNDKRVNAALVGATKGLQQLYMADNVRTMGASTVQTGVALMDPTKMLGKFTGKVVGTLGGKYIARKLTPTGFGRAISSGVEGLKRSTESVRKYTNQIFESKGAEYGRTVSDITGGGVLGSALGSVIGAGAEATAKGVSRVIPESMKEGLTASLQFAGNKFETLAGMVGARKVKRAMLKQMAKHKTAADIAKFLGKYGYVNTRATIADHFSEGNEELAQYINSKEDFAKTYGYDSGSLSDLIYNDFMMSGEIAKFYAAKAGLGSSELADDLEAMQNWKGGFFSGGIHPQVAVNTVIGAKGLYDLLTTDKAILASTIANRTTANNSRANNQVLVDRIADGKYEEVLNTLDKLQQRDQQRATRRADNKLETATTQEQYDEAKEEEFASQEYWEEQKRNVEHINRLVNDRTFNKQLEAQGIFKGTKEYNIAIADMANLQQSRIENAQERQERGNRLEQLYAQQSLREQTNRTVNDMNALHLMEDAADVAEQKEKHIQSIVDSKVSEHKKDNKEEPTAEQMKQFREEAEEESKGFEDEYNERLTEARHDAVLNRSKAINRLKALYNLKNQMKTMDDWFLFSKQKLGLHTSRPDSRILSRYVDEQIKEAKEELSRYSTNYDAKSNDTKTIEYLDNSEEAVGYGNQEIIDEEKYQAIYEANDKLYARQINAMTQDVVRNGDKFEYNPEEAAYRRKLMTMRIANDGKHKDDDNHEPVKAGDPAQSYVYRRAKQIADVQARNSALDWFLADASTGDAVTKYTEDNIAAQEKEEEEVLSALREAVDKPDISPEAKAQEKPAPVQSEKIKNRLKNNAEEYRARKSKAKAARTLADKRRRGRMRASMIFGLDNIAEAAFNKLIEQSKIGFYKFEQLYKDLEAIIEDEGFHADQTTLPLAKALYIRHYLNSTKAEKENLNTPLDVQVYGALTATTLSQDITYNAIKERIEQLQKNILATDYYVTIARNDEGKLDVFINRSSIDRIHSLRNYKEIYDVLKSNDRARILQFLDENEARFGSQNHIPMLDEILAAPNSEKLIEGLACHLTAIDASMPPAQSVRTGENVKNLVQAIMLGFDDVEAHRGMLNNPDGFDVFVEKIRGLRERMLTAGNYKLLNTATPIYSYDAKGNPVQSDADLVLVDNDGKLLLVDVRTSYKSDLKGRTLAGESIRPGMPKLIDIQQGQLRDASEVIVGALGTEVEGTMVLSVFAPGPVIAYETTYRLNQLPFNRAVTPYYGMDNEDIENAVVKPLQSELDALCEEINQISANIMSRGGEAQAYNIQIYVPGSPKAELLLQEASLHQNIEQLQLEKDHLSQKLEDLISRKKGKTQEPEFYPEDAYLHEEIPEDYIVAVAQIDEAAGRLDALLSITTDLEATTADERQKINDIVYTIYDLLTAIDSLYGKDGYKEGQFSNEQQLIASAINKLVKNQSLYGPAAQRATQWWATQFSSFVGNPYMVYFNKIRSYLDTFNDDFLNSLVGHQELQKYWATVFNNQLQQMVTAADSLQDKTSPFGQNLNSLIQEAAQFIEDYNYRFRVDPNSDFILDTQSDASINQLDVAWREAHSDTTKHFPAFRSMRENAYMSIAMDPFLIQQNFDGKVGKIELEWYNNEVCLKVVDHKGRTLHMSFDQQDDEGPRGINLLYFARKKEADARFATKVKYMLDYIKTHPGYKISFTVSRSKGAIKNGAQATALDKFLFGGELNKHNLYEITCDKANRIGILKDINGQKMVYGGKSLSTPIDGFDLEYVKNASTTMSGNYVYFYDTGQIEKPIDKRCIGVPFDRPTFSAGKGGMANKIADLLWYRAHDGATTHKGVSIDDLLGMVLYMKDPNKKLSEKYNSIESMVQIFPEQKTVWIGHQEFPLNNPNDYTALYNKLCTMHIAGNNSFMQSTMSEYIHESGNTVLTRLRNAYMANPQLDKIELDNGLVFTREDFTYGNGVGTTGLGYFLRNGFLTSRAQKLEPPCIYVDNVLLVQEMPDASASAAVEAVSNENAKDAKDDAVNSLIDNFGLFYETTNYEAQSSKPTFADKVDAWVEKVAGITPKWIGEETLSDVPYTKGAAVLAKATTSAIEMSNSVPYSIGFHEGFHRVLELLMEPSIREKVYDAYKKHNDPYADDRETAEGLADLFVDYMEGSSEANEIRHMNVVKRAFKNLAIRLSILFKYRSNSKLILNAFNDIRKGKYANNSVSKAQSDRFRSLFGESLHYEINGREFEHIGTAAEKEHMAKALGYIIVQAAENSQDIYDAVHDSAYLPIKYIPKKLIDSLTGANLERGARDELGNVAINGMTAAQAAFAEVFYAELNDQRQVDYPNFVAMSKEVQKYLTDIMDAYDGKYKHSEDNEDSDVSENQWGKSIERYDKSSYEFNKLESVSKPVKFMLATIPYYKYDNNNNLVLDTSKNIYGTPTFMPINEVYNVLASEFSDVASPEDLLKRLEAKQNSRPMYKAVYDKYKRLYDSVYSYDSEGELRSIDYDKETLMVQVFTAIKGHEHKFVVGRSFRDKQGGVEVRVSDANYDRDAAAYPRLWNSFLTSGLTGMLGGVIPNTQYIKVNSEYSEGGIKKRIPNTTASNVFKITAQYLSDLAKGLAIDSNNELTILGRTVNASSNTDIENIKSSVLRCFNMIGINLSREAFDHMLDTQYGGIGRDGLRNWLLSNPVDLTIRADLFNLRPFVNALSKAVVQDGVTTQRAIDEVFATGFVANLGAAAGAYLKVTTDKMTNGMDGTKLYNMSQNNSITAMTEDYNSNDQNNPAVRTLLNYSYNLSYRNGFPCGSIVAKALAIKDNKEKVNISVATPIGFKTDNRGDTGAKYSDLAEADDYINKYAMLQAGYCIFPTLADKGTYMVLQGISIPGMTFTTDKNTSQTVVQGAPTMGYVHNEKGQVTASYLRPNAAVLSQMLDYAYTEYQAILECRQQLGLDEGGVPLNDNEKIANYHTGETRGIRFNALTTLRVPRKDGSVQKLYISTMQPAEQLKTMEEEFFSKTLEEQEEIMALTLQEQYNIETLKAISLGIIDNVKGELKNLNLNQSLIDTLEKVIFADIQSHALTNDVQAMQKQAHNMAIVALLQDATNRAIISAEECNRLYIGNPAFFMNVEDVQKRIGGLVSTGDDNVTTLPTMDGSDGNLYTCAECEDYKVASNADCMATLRENMIEGELKEVYGDLFGFEDIDKYGIEEVKQKLIDKFVEQDMTPAAAEARVKAIEDRGESYFKSYTSGINVADGASYITADFYERMLRARGALPAKVKEAFDILRGSEAYSWKENRDATKVIYEYSNFVATKYTAYGFREHTANGETVSNTAVPYYNKFALFPIFECLATGPLKNVYDKMKESKVDNLLMTSAVKVGRQGASSFNGTTIDKPLTTYTQRLSMLRRQLNTDPEEGETAAVGTLMIKLCLASLRLDRVYGNMAGEELRDKFMSAIRKLSDKGIEKFKDRFYDDNGNVNEEKLSKYLIEQLGTRNANKNLIEALTIDSATGHMKAPIAATSDASWMESMLISAANKDIVDIMTPGSSFIQRSVFGMEGGDTELQGSDKLQMINEEGSMDAMISIDYFLDILPKGLSFNEARQWLIDHKIIGKDAKTNTVGYRIPTQAQSSIHALRFLDVVPAVKSTVILPQEFTKTTGSDKLYQCSNQYNIKNRVNCWELLIKWTISSQALRGRFND